MRTMYDAVNVAAIPSSATMVAGYFDGARIPSTLPALEARFPHAKVVTIAVRQGYNQADVYDVESGDFTPTSVVPEVMAGRKLGRWPSVYTYLWQWSAVRNAFAGQHLAEPPYWIADWTNAEHLPSGAVACQWGGPGGYDINAVAGYWPGIDPNPEGFVLIKDCQIIVDGSSGRGAGGTGIPREKIASVTGITFQSDAWAVALNEVPAEDGTAWVTVKAPTPFIAPSVAVTVRIAYNP